MRVARCEVGSGGGSGLVIAPSIRFCAVLRNRTSALTTEILLRLKPVSSSFQPCESIGPASRLSPRPDAQPGYHRIRLRAVLVV